jgi:predicted HTH transcriptional regulator
MIEEGESDELEFKSSLRWDFRQQAINKKLEEVILKSVSAFANSQGGTLLIGVDDSGKILGLEHDYSSLDGGDQDKFELHLRNLFKQAFGVSFMTNRLTVKFPSLDGHEICQIEIAAASQPLILKVADKSGQLVEHIYVRSGNSSQELPLSEAHNYLKERFG